MYVIAVSNTTREVTEFVLLRFVHIRGVGKLCTSLGLASSFGLSEGGVSIMAGCCAWWMLRTHSELYLGKKQICISITDQSLDDPG